MLSQVSKCSDKPEAVRWWLFGYQEGWTNVDDFDGHVLGSDNGALLVQFVKLGLEFVEFPELGSLIRLITS